MFKKLGYSNTVSNYFTAAPSCANLFREVLSSDSLNSARENRRVLSSVKTSSVPIAFEKLGRSSKHKLKGSVKQRFGGTCAYCGCQPRFLTLDHVVPRTQGGLDMKSNLVAVCQRCNRSKGSRPLWDWWQGSACWNEERAMRLAATVLVCKIRFVK
ncbi:MAG: HNH endonuclease [Pegethrix bostrychoides GSE-TBD4-15B]|uniref:HNH endonuclease n=1 Tax=Pegethrix bostrychoides GSE-TBD4-15B TaxID=2839662 RepID=A0A951P846_9CYAN|nr:HNH endonuclease [Pegethrix bostrychoides GSE-TBD4-15B]